MNKMNKVLSNNAPIKYFGFPLPTSLFLSHGHSPSYLMFITTHFIAAHVFQHWTSRQLAVWITRQASNLPK